MLWKIFRNLIPVAFLFVFPAQGWGRQVNYDMNCDLGKGATKSMQRQGATIVLEPSDGTCRVSILDSSKKSVFEHTSTGIQVYVGFGATLENSPAVVIQADSPRPYKLFVVTLGERPH